MWAPTKLCPPYPFPSPIAIKMIWTRPQWTNYLLEFCFMDAHATNFNTCHLSTSNKLPHMLLRAIGRQNRRDGMIDQVVWTIGDIHHHVASWEVHHLLQATSSMPKFFRRFSKIKTKNKNKNVIVHDTWQINSSFTWDIVAENHCFSSQQMIRTVYQTLE